MIPDILKSVFTFSKKELNGLVIFCFLISAILFAPLMFRLAYRPEAFDFTHFKTEIEKFKASEIHRPRYSYDKLRQEVESKETGPQYFNFDPNNLSPDSWRKLGLSNKQIKVIKNYELKGGHFYRKEDLQKIYSISKAEYARLEPYIVLPERLPGKNDAQGGFTKPAEKPVKKFIIVELNAADSAQMETVRGIGPAFASRIIKYRDRLGGFYKKEQLREVYGIDSAKYIQLEDQVSVDQSGLKTININTATFEELKRHPYLTYKQMNAIIQYRKQHGAYGNIGDLRKVLLLNDEILNRIKPYLIFQ